MSENWFYAVAGLGCLTTAPKLRQIRLSAILRRGQEVPFNRKQMAAEQPSGGPSPNFGRELYFKACGPQERLTDSRQCFKPVPELIGELNRHLEGWANYFSFGYPTGLYWEIDGVVRSRLIRQSAATQSETLSPAGRRGVVHAPPTAGTGLSGGSVRVGTCASLRREFSGEPDVGNLHLRFDEVRVGRGLPSPSLLLYWLRSDPRVLARGSGSAASNGRRPGGAPRRLTGLFRSRPTAASPPAEGAWRTAR